MVSTKGFVQTNGIDYSKTFSHVAKLDTVRILSSSVVNLDWLNQLDVKNVFVNRDLEKEVYIPSSFKNKFGSNEVQITKVANGLKQSPRACFEKIT